MGNKAKILDTVGNTPIVELTRVVPEGSARVLVKLEGHNPKGSMKDRMACAVVMGAISGGRLTPAGTVVEYTGGSTGTSLVFVCAALGYPLSIVTSDAFSREKRDHMRALGATVLELPSEGGRTTRELIQRMIAKAKELSAAPERLHVIQGLSICLLICIIRIFSRCYRAGGQVAWCIAEIRCTDKPSVALCE